MQFMVRMKRIQILAGLLSLLVSLMISGSAYAQRAGVKTNLIYDATLSPNLGVEVGIGRRWTLDISGNLNLWNWKDNMKWKHWMVQPEVRYWTCQRFAGHFFGFHALAGQFNFGRIPNNIRLFGTDFSVLTDHRYQGWAFGAGLCYGYAIPIGKHWNFELEAGLGAVYSIADGFECDVCNRSVQTGVRTLRPALTKAAISIVYLF